MKIKLEKIFLLIAFLFIVTAVSSCHPNNDERFENVNDIPVILDGDTVWSFYDVRGKISYEGLNATQPSLVVNKHFSLKNGNQISLYQFDGKPVLIPGCNNLKYVGIFNDGLIPVTLPGSRIKLIDTDGNISFELSPYKDDEIYSCSLNFSEGLLRVLTISGKYGYCNTKGEYVIPPKFSLARNFTEGLAVVEIEKSEDNKISRRFSVIDTKGNVIFNIDPDILLNTFKFYKGKLIARHIKKGVGYIDKEGNFNLFPNNPSGIGQYGDRYFAFSNEKGLWGVSSYNGKVIIKPKYLSVEFLRNQTFLVEKKNNYYIVVDRNDNVKLDFETIDQIRYYKNLGFIIKSKNKISIHNNNGVNISKKYFTNISLEKSVCSFVRSDIFKKMDPFEQFIDALSDFGIGKYNLDSPLYRVLRNSPSNYIAENEINDQYIFISDDSTHYNLKVFADKAIAKIDPNHPDKAFFNKESKIKGMKFEIYIPKENWNKEIMNFAIKSSFKGFKQSQYYIPNNKHIVYKLFQNVNSNIITEEDRKNGKLSIYLFPANEGEKMRNYLSEKQ